MFTWKFKVFCNRF